MMNRFSFSLALLLTPFIQAKEKALLVTTSELAPAWEDFIAWKKTRNIDVTLVTVEKIAAHEGKESTPEKIRQEVQTHLKSGTKWLILGGDSSPDGTKFVPDQDTVHSTMWGENADIPADIFYLSPTNWDADGDGIIGEFDDDRAAITYPDGSVGLGRIPVRTAEDVKAYTEKVKAYETSPKKSDFSNSFLYTCTVAGAYPKVRNSWDDYISKSLPEGKAERFFADESPWDKDAPGDYEITAENWVKIFNDHRYGKLHLHGHGLIHGWVMEDDRSFFSEKHLNQLKNENHYPIITTVSCFTGHFDAAEDPCITEAMLRLPKAGAVAIVAPCREGKPHFTDPRRDFPLMMKEGKLDGTTETMTLFWQEGITHSLTTGEALMKTKSLLAERAKESPNFHMCLCELHLLGDPTLPIHR